MKSLIIFIVVFAVIVVGLSVLSAKKKRNHYTKPPKPKRGYQIPAKKGYSQKQPVRRDQQPNSHVTYKKKAKSEAEVKELIRTFPEVMVDYVIDGDTVIVDKDRQKRKIRLDSIDCPEMNQHWGDISKYGLIKMIGGRYVRLEEHGIDPHERTLATIYVQDGKGSEWINVNERMVTLGHAWVMRRFYDHLPKDRQDRLNRLEKWARSNKVGMWKNPNQIPPWKWRNEE